MLSNKSTSHICPPLYLFGGRMGWKCPTMSIFLSADASSRDLRISNGWICLTSRLHLNRVKGGAKKLRFILEPILCCLHPAFYWRLFLRCDAVPLVSWTHCLSIREILGFVNRVSRNIARHARQSGKALEIWNEDFTRNKIRRHPVNLLITFILNAIY